MSDATMEQKLRLVRQVRSRYQEDQYDLSNRERILYGRTTVPPEQAGYASPYDDPCQVDGWQGNGLSSFRLRLFLAMFLVMAVIIMDTNGMTVAGITPEKIYEAISADYEEAIEAWAESLAGKGSV